MNTPGDNELLVKYIMEYGVSMQHYVGRVMTFNLVPANTND